MKLQHVTIPSWRRALLIAYGTLVLVFILAPLVVIVVTSFTSSETMGFPPPGVSLRWYARLLQYVEEAPGTKPFLAGSFGVSVSVALATATTAVVAGTMGALALFRYGRGGRALVRGMFLLPVMLPQLATGVGLLVLFSVVRFVPLWVRLVVGHSILSIPYVLLTVGAMLEARGGLTLEEAAVGLGASESKAFFLVTLPLIARGIAAGGIFSLMISFSQFTVSYFLFGGETKPLPIWILEYMSYFLDPLLAAISTVLIVATLLVVYLMDKSFGLRKIAMER